MTSVYAQAGVDFEKEHSLVKIFAALNKSTRENTRDLERIGITFPDDASDFAGGFRINAHWFQLQTGIGNIILQQCVDGPGTKPVVHALFNGSDPEKRASVGIDSVAMVVNDLICSGARPVSLTEYHSWHDTDIAMARDIARGNEIAARLSGATMVGGENASLPQMITGPVPNKAYDMCHMATGIVLDKYLVEHPLGKRRVRVGDIAIGLSSSGIHCNGVTLAWKTAIKWNEYGFKNRDFINEHVPELGMTPAEAILTPTTIYVGAILDLLGGEYGAHVHAIANVTGEGVHNLKRVLPEHCGLYLKYGSEQEPDPHSIFNYIMNEAKVPRREMYEDYNMGTGMVVFVDKEHAATIRDTLGAFGSGGDECRYPQERFKAYELGEVTDKNGDVLIRDHEGYIEVY